MAFSVIMSAPIRPNEFASWFGPIRDMYSNEVMFRGSPICFRPCFVGDFADMVRHFYRQFDSFTFDNRARHHLADNVVTIGRHWNATGRPEMTGQAVAGEICQICAHVCRVLHGFRYDSFADLPVGLNPPNELLRRGGYG